MTLGLYPAKHPTRLVIFAQDIISIHACSPSSASRRIKEVKSHFLKHDHQEITINEYCFYWGLNYQETCEFLKLM